MNVRLGVMFGALLAIGSLSGPAEAAPPVTIETDPSTFVLRGFAAHARVQPEGSHFAFGVGVYALDYPSLLVDLNGANRGGGWNVRLTVGAGVFADYYFERAPRAWFVGVQLAMQRFRYTNDAAPAQDATATNATFMPRVGYLWRPFDAGFYLMPWAGVGGTAQIAGTRGIAGREYNLFPVVAFATVHIGWQF